MGAFVSLPLLSLFALPALSNYSTSLNLLFFWMTWSTLVLSHPPLKVEFVGSLFIRAIFFLVPSLLFLALDTLLPSLAVSIKAQGDVALPARKGGKRVAKVVGLSVFNVLLGVALMSGVEYLCTEVGRFPSRLRVSTTLPMPWHIAKDVAIGLFCRNTLQYYIHAHLLHSPSPRNPLTRLHLRYAHSIPAPYSITAHYDHPLPYLIGHWLPLYLPALILRPHILTFQLLLALTSIEETLVYSGYSVLPSAIVLAGMARRCDAHYRSKGEGNYAPWGLLDWVHGTAVGADVVDDVDEELEKKGLDVRTEGLLEDARDVVGDLGRGISKGLGGKRGRGRPKKN